MCAPLLLQELASFMAGLAALNATPPATVLLVVLDHLSRAHVLATFSAQELSMLVGGLRLSGCAVCCQPR